MYIFFIILQVFTCLGLILFVLVQSGKGKGLVEGFSSAESIFGTKTNSFLVKTTSVFAIVFFINCLVLAFLTIQQNKSKMSSYLPVSTKADKIKKEVDKALKEIKEEKAQAEKEAAPQQENKNIATVTGVDNSGQNQQGQQPEESKKDFTPFDINAAKDTQNK